MSVKIVRQDIAAIAEGLKHEAKKFEGKTILISGGGGFLGKYIVGTLCYLNDKVLSKPCRVISVDNFITGRAHPHFNYKGRSDIIEVWGDVTHPLPIREPVHYILHAAGLASPVYYKKFPLETIDSAILGVRNLLELAKANADNLEGFVFFSSSEIYGDPDPSAVPTPETYHGYVSSIGPRACYDESKRLAETVTTVYVEKYGLSAKIVRPFNVFGPGMGHDDRRVLPMFAFRALNKRPIPVHGDGHQTRTFCYITDATTGFLKVLVNGRPGEAYNIGNSDNEISMKDLAELFVDLEGGRSKVELIPYPSTYPAGEPQRRCPDLTKVKKELAFQPKVSLRTGLRRFIDWCRSEDMYKEKLIKVLPKTPAIKKHARI
ncbi:MAG: NAD-dependent epimerase/dehydratase family protein [Candidatus Taylorbacteria bacterium]|nr:NAD-dependent epimerase/dehydratase family protein [Candidatus Taylorbacteria bacterium]